MNRFAMVIAWIVLSIPLAAQEIPAGYFGLHRQCTDAIDPSTNENYNGDCGTLTVAWPNIPTAAVPANPFGLLRLWDTKTKFGDIAASSNPSLWVWDALDQNIREARTNNVEVLWVPEGKTPSWACSSGSGCSASSVPTDTNLENFLNAALARSLDTSTGQVCTSGSTCRPIACQTSGTWAGITTGCIGYMETWNEPNTSGSYSGTIAQLVHIERITYQSAHLSGLSVKVVSPSYTYAGPAITNACTGSNNSPESYACAFLTTTGSGSGDLTGKAYADIVGFHAYPAVNQSGTTGILASTSTTTGIAEATFDNRINGMTNAMSTDSVTLCPHGTALGTGGCKELWNTEYSWGVLGDGSAMNTEVTTATCSNSAGCPRINPTNDASSTSPQSTCPNTLGLHGYGCWANDQGAFVVKTMALGWSLGLSRNVWYWWGAAGTNAWGAIYCATVNTAIGCNQLGIQPAGTSYGSIENWLVGLTQTSPCTVSSNIWTCDYSGPAGYTARIIWDSSRGPGETELYPTTGFTRARDMLGNVSFPVGSEIGIGYAPVILESAKR